MPHRAGENAVYRLYMPLIVPANAQLSIGFRRLGSKCFKNSAAASPIFFDTNFYEDAHWIRHFGAAFTRHNRLDDDYRHCRQTRSLDDYQASGADWPLHAFTARSYAEKAREMMTILCFPTNGVFQGRR